MLYSSHHCLTHGSGSRHRGISLSIKSSSDACSAASILGDSCDDEHDNDDNDSGLERSPGTAGHEKSDKELLLPTSMPQ